ncbi:MAG TPA: cytochrome c biogenesis protein CcdA [Polyangiaceae bacterium]|nr:cytochrome c biogenesis protein CcdA [Polyangiaceae bacterium]
MTVTTLLALYLAGLATFLSPCILPLLPLYLSVLGGSRESTRGRLALAGVGFVLGMSVVFVCLGLGASVLASTLGAHRRLLLMVAGTVMVLFGAQLVGALQIGSLERDLRPLLARVPAPGGFAGGVLFGAAFSLGWTPCVGPVLGAALSYSASRSSSAALAGAELGVYALGLSTPLLAAAFAAPRVLAFARRARGATPIIQRAMGVLLIALGLFVASDHLGALAPSIGASGQTLESPSCEATNATACALPQSNSSGLAAPADLPPGPHLIEFFSGHCTVCAKMAPVLAELERRCTSGDGAILRVNVETPAGRALADQYAVRAVPTFLQVDANGREVERVVGELSRSELALALTSVRGERCTVL